MIESSRRDRLLLLRKNEGRLETGRRSRAMRHGR